MKIRCEAEELFPGIEKLIKKLSDGIRLEKMMTANFGSY